MSTSIFLYHALYIHLNSISTFNYKVLLTSLGYVQDKQPTVPRSTFMHRKAQKCLGLHNCRLFFAIIVNQVA